MFGFKGLCRKNETTITAALQTLIAGMLFSNLPSECTSLACATPFSARRFLEPSSAVDDDSMGVFVLDGHETYQKSSFIQFRSVAGQHNIMLLPWSEAQRSRRDMQKIVEQRGKNTGVGLLKFVGDFQKELFQSKVGKDRDSSYEISNLGLYKAVTLSDDNAQSVSIGRMIFTQSAGVTASAVQISVLTGADGCMVLGFTWQEGVVDDDLIGRIVEGANAEILRLVREA
jgi:hypothetical protein